MSNDEKQQDSSNPYAPIMVEQQKSRSLLAYLFLALPNACVIAGILSDRVIVPLSGTLIDDKQTLFLILVVSWGFLTISMTGLMGVLSKEQLENPQTPMRRKIAIVLGAALPWILLVMYVGILVYRYYCSLL